jgi:hypothetical protein
MSVPDDAARARAVKFRDLPIGGRFRFQGSEWVKSGPIAGQPAQGGAARMFAQSARVEPLLDGARTTSPAREKPIPRARCVQAIDAFSDAMRDMLEDQLPPATTAGLLDRARAAALSCLDEGR